MIRSVFIVSVISFLCFPFISACNGESAAIETESSTVNQTPTVQDTNMKDTTFELLYSTRKVPVNIQYTDKPMKGTILLLHGWNLPGNEWCDKTDLCEKALLDGYNVIAPDFGKSTYQWQMFPETIENYRIYPTRQWMYDTFLVECQNKFSLLKNDQFNVVCGLSTGGRGAALFALEKPDLFDVCIALSADFDQTKISDEPINTGFYGSYKEFQERWSGKDNIHNRAAEWKVPVYLGHGSLDKVCPTDQTVQFHSRLDSLGFSDMKLSTPEFGHSYDYWGYETDSILEFINKYHK